MIETRREFQLILRETLSAEIDPVLTVHGFHRRKNSMEYKRACKDGKQSLLMYFEFRPRYHPGADGRIYPWIRLSFPSLNALVLDMLGRDPALLGDPETTVSQPMDKAIPKDQFTRWYTHGRESMVECVRSITSSLEKWVVPFLDEYTTASSLATAYEKHDERLVWQRGIYIYVAAAYLLTGQANKAKQVLEDHFGAPGPRREYARAFEYVSAHLENT